MGDNEMQSSLNKRLVLLLIAGVVGLFVWISVSALLRLREKGRAHAVARTRATLIPWECLAVEIEVLLQEHPGADVRRFRDLQSEDAMEYYHINPQSGLVLDSWGNPIRLRPSSNPAMVFLVSYGPNARDDGGKRDDILVECKACIETVFPVPDPDP